MKLRTLWAGGAAAAIALALIVPGTASSATGTTPPWEPDPNAEGSVTFYDASGNVITGGNDLSHLYDYAVASTAATRSTTKAQTTFAFPDHTKADSTQWFQAQASAATVYPNAGAPAPINGFTNPVATVGPDDANLQAILGTTIMDQTAGWANIVQIRLKDSGAGIGNGVLASPFWETDISIDTVAGTWTQLYPPGPTSTTTGLAASPAGHAAPGDTVTLTATVTPSDAAGSVQFLDGATAIGSPVTVTSGSAQTTTSSLSTGTHSLTAAFTPTDSSAFTGSTSTAVSYVVADVPGPPTAVNGSAGNAQATVSWTAPINDGGAAITGYDVQYSSNGGSTWTSANPAFHNSTATTQQVTGLTNGTAYIFRVAAINGAGQGAYSSPSTDVTPVADTTSLKAAASKTINYGANATTSATLRDTTTNLPITGAQLKLYKRPRSSSPWTFVANATTIASGVASKSLAQTANTQYQWRFLGDARHSPATSGTQTISVAQVVSAKASSGRVKHGVPFKIYGTVKPASSGQKVTLQRQAGRKWTSIGTVSIKRQKLPNGKTTVGFVFTVKQRTKGTFKYRVSKAATATLVAGTSATLTVKIT